MEIENLKKEIHKLQKEKCELWDENIKLKEFIKNSEIKIKCNKCLKVFKTYSGLERHIKTSYYCD